MNKHQPQINRESCLTLVNAIGGSQLGQTLAKQWRGKILLTLAGLAATTTPGHAMKINATYSSAISLETTQTIAKIGKHWEQELKDPITLNLNFSFSNNLPTGVLGGSKPGMIRVNYKDHLTALGQDYSSQDDISAVKSKLTDLDDQALFNKL